MKGEQQPTIDLWSVFITLAILKVCNILNWSWWCITAPLWLPLVVFLMFLLYCVIFALIEVIKQIL